MTKFFFRKIHFVTKIGIFEKMGSQITVSSLKNHNTPATESMSVPPHSTRQLTTLIQAVWA